MKTHLEQIRHNNNKLKMFVHGLKVAGADSVLINELTEITRSQCNAAVRIQKEMEAEEEKKLVSFNDICEHDWHGLKLGTMTCRKCGVQITSEDA